MLLANKELNEYDRGVNMSKFIDFSEGGIKVGTDIAHNIYKHILMHYRTMTEEEDTYSEDGKEEWTKEID